MAQAVVAATLLIEPTTADGLKAKLGSVTAVDLGATVRALVAANTVIRDAPTGLYFLAARSLTQAQLAAVAQLGPPYRELEAARQRYETGAKSANGVLTLDLVLAELQRFLWVNGRASAETLRYTYRMYVSPEQVGEAVKLGMIGGTIKRTNSGFYHLPSVPVAEAIFGPIAPSQQYTQLVTMLTAAGIRLNSAS